MQGAAQRMGAALRTAFASAPRASAFQPRPLTLSPLRNPLYGQAVRRIATRNAAPSATLVAPGSAPVTLLRRMATAAAEFEQKYVKSMQVVHWAAAAGFLTCIGTVKVAQYTKGDTKALMMHVHKSVR